MKYNIFNALGWFRKNKCESQTDKTTQCHCKSLEEMRVEHAVKVSEPEALEKFLNDKKIEFEKINTWNYNGLYDYSIKIKDIEILINTTNECDFYKSACLSCNTCLGWSYGNYYDSHSVINPNEHFNNLIKNKIIAKKKDIELYAALDKKRIEAKRLAKEICGEI